MIRKATLQDIPAIIEIFAAGRAYMRQTGNLHQWSGGYPDESIIRSDIEAGECFVIVQKTVCAVFTLLSQPDPTYAYIEGAWLTDGPYGTIHRIASNGTVRGVVQMAVDFALQYHKVLRCDTHKDNLSMQAALERAGFIHCGVIYLADGDPREAYERLG